jgi:nitroreductase
VDIEIPPEIGTPLPAAHPSHAAIRMLRLRRSTSPELMTEPGPREEQLRTILEIGARVPDHRRVFPFRFILFRGEGRAAAGHVLAHAFAAANPDADDARIEIERRRFLRAPLVIGVVARLDPAHKTPEWEQTLTCGAVGQNLLLAASAHGFAACWITEWYSYDRTVLDAFGLKSEERMAGFVYVGMAKDSPKERPRPDLQAITAVFSAPLPPS